MQCGKFSDEDFTDPVPSSQPRGSRLVEETRSPLSFTMRNMAGTTHRHTDRSNLSLQQMRESNSLTTTLVTLGMTLWLLFVQQWRSSTSELQFRIDWKVKEGLREHVLFPRKSNSAESTSVAQIVALLSTGPSENTPCVSENALLHSHVSMPHVLDCKSCFVRVHPGRFATTLWQIGASSKPNEEKPSILGRLRTTIAWGGLLCSHRRHD